MLNRRPALAAFTYFVFSSPAQAKLFLVADPADEPDYLPGDGECSISPPGGQPVCTLRAAVMEANIWAGTDTVGITIPGPFTLTRIGSDDTAYLGDLDINSNIVIEAVIPGVVIQAGSTTAIDNRILHITGSAYTLNLRNVTISGGKAPDGGNIYNNGTILFRDVIVQNGVAQNFGGGLYNNITGVARTEYGYSVTFASNKATTKGGAVYNEGELEVAAAVFVSNAATSPAYSAGGALYNSSTGDAVLSDTTLSGNSGGFIGGAIVNEGALAIYESTFSDNSSGTAGGAICHHAGALSVNTSEFELNSSRSGGAMHLASAVGMGSLRLNVFEGNSATDGGGAIWMTHASGTVRDSTFSGNTAPLGGAIKSDHTFTLVNSTVSGNIATNLGGGVYHNHSGSSFSAYSSTITDNQAAYGGGIYGDAGLTRIKNTIVAGNTATSQGDDCDGTITSAGYSLIGDVDDCSVIPGATDQYGSASGAGVLDPMLDVLAYNGGFWYTWTHALLAGSPAIDAGDPGGCTDGVSVLRYDQRFSIEYQRHRDGDGDSISSCDIGAFEYTLPWP